MIVILTLMIFSLGQPEEISLLSEQEGKEVAVKGYVHRSLQGAWILTSHPNTPSCCVASSHEREKQVVLHEGESIAVSEHPVVVKGRLIVSSGDPKFELMESLVLLEEKKKKVPWVTFLLVILLIGGFFLRNRLTGRKDSPMFDP